MVRWCGLCEATAASAAWDDAMNATGSIRDRCIEECKGDQTGGTADRDARLRFSLAAQALGDVNGSGQPRRRQAARYCSTSRTAELELHVFAAGSGVRQALADGQPEPGRGTAAGIRSRCCAAAPATWSPRVRGLEARGPRDAPDPGRRGRIDIELGYGE